MKVLLYHGRYANSWEAQGLGLLAAYVRRHRPDVEFQFFQGCFDADAAVIAAARDAEVACFSCTSPSFAHAARLLGAMRSARAEIRAVIGGYHASAVPDECLAAGFDQAVVGEGEYALLAILDGLRDPIVYGKPWLFAEPLWPDRELIKNERNIQVAFRDTGLRITSFQAHRGCPFSCRFCADGARKVMSAGRPIACRHRPVEDLVAEIVHVAALYELDFFKFCDGTWNSSAAWVLDFCSAKTRSPAARLPWFANVQAGLLTEQTALAMASAGCRQVGVGIESGSSRVLAAIGKGTTRDAIARGCGLAQAAGLSVRGYFILGLPEETEEDLAETEEFAENLDLDEYGFTILCPYPGSSYYHEDPASWQGLSWENIDEYTNDFWHSAAVSNARLRHWQRRLTEKFEGRLTQRQPRGSREPQGLFRDAGL